MGRLRVRCPLHAQSCRWEGDYSELGSHLTSSDTHLIEAKGVAAAQTAEAFNDQGNQRFNQNAFREAIKLYSKALSIAPAAKYLGNRCDSVTLYDDIE
jgi:hypothetical protein